jgi:F-type H+-transporting ATPase subunit delta
MADLCKEYASALFSLAYEKELVKEIKGDMENINKVIKENPDYLEILSSPALTLSNRLSLIDEAFGDKNEYVVSFLKLLCENRNIASLSEIINELFMLFKELENRVIAKIYYAFEPTSEQKEKLISKLKGITKKEIDPIFIEDKGLIGGIKIELDGRVLDGSLSTRLNNIKGVIG